jgi:hypothetical protein
LALLQKKVFGVVSNLAYDFKAFDAVDFGANDIIQQAGYLPVASAPVDEEVFPVRLLGQCGRFLVKPVPWVPELERAATVVSPEQGLVGEAIEAM